MTHYILIDQNGKYISEIVAEERPENPVGKGWSFVASGEEGYDALITTILVPLKTAAILKTYLDADDVISAAIGNRAQEYLEAETAALAYQAAGFTGDASAYVTGYATYNATGEAQTNEWSALQIIARANAMRAAQLSLRNTRFQTQASIRAASSYTSLQETITTWNAFVAVLRSQLGV